MRTNELSITRTKTGRIASKRGVKIQIETGENGAARRRDEIPAVESL